MAEWLQAVGNAMQRALSTPGAYAPTPLAFRQIEGSLEKAVQRVSLIHRASFYLWTAVPPTQPTTMTSFLQLNSSTSSAQRNVFLECNTVGQLLCVG